MPSPRDTGSPGGIDRGKGAVADTDGWGAQVSKPGDESQEVGVPPMLGIAVRGTVVLGPTRRAGAASPVAGSPFVP